MIFGHFSHASITWKLEMNLFYGIRMFCRLFGESEQLNLLYSGKKGLSNGTFFPNLNKITLKYDFWTLFTRFHFMKVRNESFFAIRMFLRLFGESVLWNFLYSGNKGLSNGSFFPNLNKIALKINSGHFSHASTSWKLEIDPFYGIRMFWRLFENLSH